MENFLVEILQVLNEVEVKGMDNIARVHLVMNSISGAIGDIRKSQEGEGSLDEDSEQ